MGDEALFIFEMQTTISECTVPRSTVHFRSNGLGTHHVAEVARGMKLMGHILDGKSIM